jgi:glycosyltransferase involved in cell wall biosynthesis
MASLTLATFLHNLFEVLTLGRRLVHLRDVHPVDLAQAPPVSVIIPACNEEATVEAAMQSVLLQDYPRLEVIAVNDRSTDRTGEILHRMGLSMPQLKVVDVEELPQGWLGKNHAMQTGALAAGGDWLLFADADVVMERTAIGRAIAHAEKNGLDQLAVGPRVIVGGFLSKAFVSLFGVLFGMHTKPWKVSDPKTKEFVGIGAFNLVRAGAWRAVNGFVPIALRPDDDVKLGKLLKTSGHRCGFAFGTELLSVEWYASFRAMRDGFLKNMFSVFQYNPWFALFGVTGIFMILVWPFIAVVAFRGVLQWLNVGIILTLFLFTAGFSWRAKLGWWWAFALPLAAVLEVYLIARTVIINLLDGGIWWRGTKYSLELLRTNRF